MAKEKAEKKIKEALGREDKGHSGGKHHVHEMHVRRAAGGGYIARHDMADESGAPANMLGGGASPEHILPDADALHAHMDEHMGDQPAMGEAPPPPGGAPGGDGGEEQV